MTSRVVNFLEI